MRIELCQSGLEWIDGNLGGLPARQPALVVGPSRSGKTCFAATFAVASLAHNPTCVVTTDAPESFLEFAEHYLERDLRPSLRDGTLTILRVGPHFESKVRAYGSAERPLDELRKVLIERRIESVVFDTLDPLLAWVDEANAKNHVRQLLLGLNALGATTVCTAVAAEAPAVRELAANVSGVFELRVQGTMNSLRVRSASWCRISDLQMRTEFVQRRGIVAVGDATGTSWEGKTGLEASPNNIPTRFMAAVKPPNQMSSSGLSSGPGSLTRPPDPAQAAPSASASQPDPAPQTKATLEK
jgi:KaiC/GvpD/RAD55 family RecA-like ATPase